MSNNSPTGQNRCPILNGKRKYKYFPEVKINSSVLEMFWLERGRRMQTVRQTVRRRISETISGRRRISGTISGRRPSGGMFPGSLKKKKKRKSTTFPFSHQRGMGIPFGIFLNPLGNSKINNLWGAVWPTTETRIRRTLARITGRKKPQKQLGL